VRHLLVNQNELVVPWVAKQSGGDPTVRGVSIGLLDDTTGILAGVFFEDYTGTAVFAHMAVDKTKGTVTRQFISFCLDYVFSYLNCAVLYCYVPSSNLASRQFVERLGFTLKATLEEAHPQGNLLLYELRKENCIWLTSKRVAHEQSPETSTST
jgi:hypothetical protein